jgi:prolyl-tRNA editing enzyme YbaK/EbsC (Cys-tRNA(Pro) deacylase)
VEERKVADHLGVARRRVRLATAQEALQASGFAVGTVAPFGAQRRRQRTLQTIAC